MMDRYLLGNLVNDSIHVLESSSSFQKYFENYLKSNAQNPQKFNKNGDEKVLEDFSIYHGQLQLIIESDSFYCTNSIYLHYVPYINININSAVLNIYHVVCSEDIDLNNILQDFKKIFKRRQIKYEHVNLYDGSTDQNILKINLTDNEKIDFFYNIVRVLELDLNLNQNISKSDFI